MNRLNSWIVLGLTVLIAMGCSKHSPPPDTNPKVKDLGEIKVSTDKTIRCDLGENKTCVIVPRIFTNGSAKFVKMKISIEMPDSNGTVKKIASPQVIVNDGQSAEVQVGDVGISFTTKIE